MATTSSVFYTSFQAQKSAIIARINAGALSDDTARSEALSAVNALAEECTRLAGTLPAYDRQTYRQQLDQLYAQLDTKAARKGAGSRFKFSKKALDSAKTEQANERKAADELAKAKESASTNLNIGYMNEFVVKDKSQVLVHSTTTSSTSSRTSSNLILANIEQSVIVLTPSTPFATAKLDWISDSIIYIDAVTGPIYLNHLTRCVVVAVCHQFRMHDSTGTDLFLSCGSGRPIIERCSGLRFAQFRFTEIRGNDWQEVDDFNWLASDKQSVNWRRLTDAEDYTDDLKKHLSSALAKPADDTVDGVQRSRKVNVKCEFPGVTLFC